MEKEFIGYMVGAAGLLAGLVAYIITHINVKSEAIKLRRANKEMLLFLAKNTDLKIDVSEKGMPKDRSKRKIIRKVTPKHRV